MNHVKEMVVVSLGCMFAELTEMLHGPAWLHWLLTIATVIYACAKAVYAVVVTLDRLRDGRSEKQKQIEEKEL